MGNEAELVRTAEYYKPQLLSFGGDSFCGFANNKSLTHSVFLARWVFHWACFSFFFLCTCEKKKGLPCLAAGDAI